MVRGITMVPPSRTFPPRIITFINVRMVTILWESQEVSWNKLMSTSRDEPNEPEDN